MTNHKAGISALIGLASVGLVVALSGSDVEATVTTTQSTTVTCKPFNLITADAGMSIVECGSGYVALYLETESTTPAYFCGTVTPGVADGGYLAACKKRCVGCNNGSTWSIEGRRGTVKCVSGTADAGVLFAVDCARN